ncbi:uncharacterized protein BP5553_08726 [Venustampulla echinocandica]|uniref:D-serine dehydratase n=1 Tax=Venustampulla echinocandica TaxID=2656787 RepID=A0A370TF15_9HELO|nr:uncharacterized protein BP5553_08726 [Venustampulla echinocandica]RDL33287.1 hypothetical protein BP5553_08726 [Venustampulla echinocandica]
MATHVASLYPLPAKEALKEEFVGKSLNDVATPAAVLDLSKVKSNCNRMLEAVEALGFGWRVHIKTHKTTELTRLQVGGGTGPVKIVVSTLVEAENILPLMLEYKSTGRVLLYSFPISPAAVERLSVISSAIGPGGLSLMVDHPGQLESVSQIHKSTSITPLIFLKIDMGSHRAGVVPQTDACYQLIASVVALETAGTCRLLGLYSHAGHSYGGNSRAAAVDLLRQEFEALLVTTEAVHSVLPLRPLILSVGATPTTTSVRNLLIPDLNAPTDEQTAIAALRSTIAMVRERKCDIEAHAGVYPVLDCQQLATHALPTQGPNALLTWNDLAFTILSEIASIYPGRGKDGSPEVLVGSGSLALGREPCKAYDGWGILSPWNRKGVQMPSEDLEKHAGWKVGKISQEHGILGWGGKPDEADLFEIGQKVKIWPNHACISGAGFDWYLVVDGSRKGKEDEIIDVWPRWRGW